MMNFGSVYVVSLSHVFICSISIFLATQSAVVSADTNTSLTCDFEDGPCGWVVSSCPTRSISSSATHDNANPFQWRRGSDKTGTPDRSSGPLFDHTYLGRGKDDGHFMFAAANVATPFVSNVACLSQSNITLDSKQNFSFWLLMNGQNAGNLSLLRVGKTGDVSILWSASGGQGRDWTQALVILDEGTDFMLSFQISVDYRFGADTGLDDVLLESQPPAERYTPPPLPPTTRKTEKSPFYLTPPTTLPPITTATKATQSLSTPTKLKAPFSEKEKTSSTEATTEEVPTSTVTTEITTTAIESMPSTAEATTEEVPISTVATEITTTAIESMPSTSTIQEETSTARNAHDTTTKSITMKEESTVTTPNFSTMSISTVSMSISSESTEAPESSTSTMSNSTEISESSTSQMSNSTQISESSTSPMSNNTEVPESSTESNSNTSYTSTRAPGSEVTNSSSTNPQAHDTTNEIIEPSSPNPTMDSGTTSANAPVAESERASAGLKTGTIVGIVVGGCVFVLVVVVVIAMVVRTRRASKNEISVTDVDYRERKQDGDSDKATVQMDVVTITNKAFVMPGDEESGVEKL